MIASASPRGGAARGIVSGVPPFPARRRALLSLAPLSFVIGCPAAARGYDNSFDYTSFETGFGQPHFDVLNYPSLNGNYMMTSTDNHRAEMNANGNELAQFYNNFLADYNTQFRAGGHVGVLRGLILRLRPRHAGGVVAAAGHDFRAAEVVFDTDVRFRGQPLPVRGARGPDGRIR